MTSQSFNSIFSVKVLVPIALASVAALLTACGGGGQPVNTSSAENTSSTDVDNTDVGNTDLLKKILNSYHEGGCTELPPNYSDEQFEDAFDTDVDVIRRVLEVGEELQGTPDTAVVINEDQSSDSVSILDAQVVLVAKISGDETISVGNYANVIGCHTGKGAFFTAKNSMVLGNAGLDSIYLSDGVITLSKKFRSGGKNTIAAADAVLLDLGSMPHSTDEINSKEVVIHSDIPCGTVVKADYYFHHNVNNFQSIEGGHHGDNAPGCLSDYTIAAAAGSGAGSHYEPYTGAPLFDSTSD